MGGLINHLSDAVTDCLKAVSSGAAGFTQLAFDLSCLSFVTALLPGLQL